MARNVRFGQLVLVLMMALAGTGAFADEATSQDTTKLDTTVVPAKPTPTAPSGENVDDLITNNNLRAYSGSTSLWSIASQFNYNGGTIDAPLSQDRPNIAQQSGTTTKSDLDGSISVKYNLNTKNSLLAGFGIRWIAPLTPSGPTNYDGTRFDAMNPYIEYQYIYKWLGIQSVLQVEFMEWTQADQTALGYARQLNIDQENMYQIGDHGWLSNLSIGASVWAQYQWFNKSGSYGDPNSDNYIADIATQQSVYALSFSPELEYQFSEKLNFRTLVCLWQYEHYASMPKALSFTHDGVFQSVGVGISVTRDVFLYPNVQFLPDHIEAALTNVGLTATVNLF